MYLGQTKQAKKYFLQASKLNTNENCWFNIALANVYNHDFYAAKKAIENYSEHPSLNFCQLKRYIFSKIRPDASFLLEKNKEEERLSTDISAKKTETLNSSKNSKETVKNNQNKKSLYFKYVKSFDSRKFPLLSNTPDIKPCPKPTPIHIKRSLSTFSSKKRTLSCLSPQPLFYYGKASETKPTKKESINIPKPETSEFIQESLNNQIFINEELNSHKLFEKNLSSFYENQTDQFSNFL